MYTTINKVLSRIATFVRGIGRTIELAAIVSGVLVAIGLGGVISGIVLRTAPIIIWGGALLIIGVILVILLYTILEETRQDKKTIAITWPPKWVPASEGDLIIVLKDLVYEYGDEGPVKQTKRFIIEAMRDGVRNFPDRYLWTGTGKCEVRSLTPGCTITILPRKEFWHYFEVNFQPLRKGQQMEFTLQWDLLDDKRTAVPFYSTMIDFATSMLKMRVILPSSPSRANFHEFIDYVDMVPTRGNKLDWDPATRSLYAEVKNPALRQRFVIEWYYDGES